jgi:hypothetical protein
MVEVILERGEGLDVHRDTVSATVRVPGKGRSRRRRVQETRTFGTTIAQLERLAGWPGRVAVTRVGLGSTGCDWKPVLSRWRAGSTVGLSMRGTSGTSPAVRRPTPPCPNQPFSRGVRAAAVLPSGREIAGQTGPREPSFDDACCHAGLAARDSM